MPGKETRPLSVEELEGYVSNLRTVATSLNRMAEQMRAGKIAKFDVVGQRMADRGLMGFDTLLGSVKREMNKHNIKKKKEKPSR